VFTTLTAAIVLLQARAARTDPHACLPGLT